MKTLLTAAALALAGLAAPAAAQNWDATVAETPAGHRVGNPDADMSVILFTSYSCPHCAHFEVESDAAMRLAYIATGKANMEVRHVLRNPLDVAAALVTECGPEDKFWANHRTLLRDQDRWLKIAAEAGQAQTARWMTGSLGERMKAIASDLGFYRLMEQRGYSVPELDRCLTDQAALQSLIARAESDAAEFAVPGTPSFALDGALLDGVHSWQGLSSAMQAAQSAPAGE